MFTIHKVELMTDEKSEKPKSKEQLRAKSNADVHFKEPSKMKIERFRKSH